MPLGNPGVPGANLPAGEDFLVRRVKAVEDALREGLASISTSFGPAMAALTAQQAATAANVADIAANVASINTLITQVVKPLQVFFYAQNFALTTAASTFASQTVTVPAGFTKAVVLMVGRLYAINPNAGTDYLSAVSKIAGSGGFSLQSPVATAQVGTNVSPYSKVLTGLVGGGTFLLEVQGNTTLANWAANAVNTAEMSGAIFWFR